MAVLDEFYEKKVEQHKKKRGRGERGEGRIHKLQIIGCS